MFFFLNLKSPVLSWDEKKVEENLHIVDKGVFLKLLLYLFLHIFVLSNKQMIYEQQNLTLFVFTIEYINYLY